MPDLLFYFHLYLEAFYDYLNINVNNTFLIIQNDCTFKSAY